MRTVLTHPCRGIFPRTMNLYSVVFERLSSADIECLVWFYVLMSVAQQKARRCTPRGRGRKRRDRSRRRPGHGPRLRRWPRSTTTALATATATATACDSGIGHGGRRRSRLRRKPRPQARLKTTALSTAAATLTAGVDGIGHGSGHGHGSRHWSRLRRQSWPRSTTTTTTTTASTTTALVTAAATKGSFTTAALATADDIGLSHRWHGRTTAKRRAIRAAKSSAYFFSKIRRQFSVRIFDERCVECFATRSKNPFQGSHFYVAHNVKLCVLCYVPTVREGLAQRLEATLCNSLETSISEIIASFISLLMHLPSHNLHWRWTSLAAGLSRLDNTLVEELPKTKHLIQSP